MRNFLVICEKRPTSSVLHNGRASGGKCCVNVDEELAGKAREVNWERLLVNSGL